MVASIATIATGSNKDQALSPRQGITPGQTGRLTVGRNIILTLTCLSQLRVAGVKTQKRVSEPGKFENPEEGERPPLQTATKQRLLKTKLTNLF
jgi:hypothetical protein